MHGAHLNRSRAGGFDDAVDLQHRAKLDQERGRAVEAEKRVGGVLILDGRRHIRKRDPLPGKARGRYGHVERRAALSLRRESHMMLQLVRQTGQLLVHGNHVIRQRVGQQARADGMNRGRRLHLLERQVGPAGCEVVADPGLVELDQRYRLQG